MITYRQLGEIKAITFDLDDTLYDNMPYIFEAEKCLQEHIRTRYPIAASITPAKWKHIKIETLNEKPEIMSDISLFRYTVLTKGFKSVGMHEKLITSAVQDCFDFFYFKRSDFTLPKSIHSLLKNLSAKLPIAAITNGNVDCQAIGIQQYFTHILQAGPQQAMKPSPVMFEQMSTLLQIPAQHILHVGDDLEKDVKGAILSGYQAAWYAIDRKMHLKHEPAELLPHIQLESLQQLQTLV